MDFTELVPLPDRSQYNVGLTSPRNAKLLELFGNPRDTYTGSCQPIENAKFRQQVSRRKFGNVAVEGLTVALHSLEEIFQRVSREVPGLIPLLGTAGMLCCRRVKTATGLSPNISNHSWGIAVDVTVGGKLDDRGDHQAQRGLLILSTYFNAAGWFWGASFPLEDSMHFETSTQLLNQWRKDGLI